MTVKSVSRLLVIKVIFFIIFIAVKGDPVMGQDRILESKIDEYLKPFLEMGNFSGAILIAKGDEILVSKGYGKADLESEKPNSPNTLFRLGSLGKQFAATVILRLAEEGKLSLSDKINRFLPGYKFGDSVTIRHLLTHTSGIPPISLPDGMQLGFSEFINAMNTAGLDFKPGTKYRYSNIGYNLLVIIATLVTQREYQELVKEFIIDPAQMNRTFFIDGLKIDDTAFGYYLSEEGPKNASVLMSGIYSTVSDYYKFIRAIDTNKILNKSSVEQMFTVTDFEYAYAWARTSVNDLTEYNHIGKSPGYISRIAKIPEENLTVIIFCNIANTPVDKIGTDVAAIVLNKKIANPKRYKQIALSDNRLNQVVGNYQSPEGHLLIIKQVGKSLYLSMALPQSLLMFSENERADFLLYAESMKSFFLKDLDVYFQTIEDIKGCVEAICIQQDEKIKVFKRVE